MSNQRSLLQRAAVIVATGFGLGYSPIASGTVGSVWGVLLGWWMLDQLSLGPQIMTASALALLAVPVCDLAEKAFGRKDDGRIVADEFMTFPICVIGLPLSPLALLIAFLTNRVFDILKPPPARGLQAIRGGFGVVIDDVFAALYSLAANHLILRFLG